MPKGERMYCHACGAANPEGSVFCQACGSAVTQPSASPPPPPGPPTGPPVVSDVPRYVPPTTPAHVGATAFRPPSMAASRLLFMEPVLRHLSGGDLFKSVVSWALVIGGVLIGIGGVVACFLALRLTFEGTVGAVFAGLVLTIMTVVLTYMLVHTYLIRARTVQDLPESRYSVVPIVAVILRLSGEVMAIYMIFAGLSVFVLALFLGSSSAGSFLPTPGMMSLNPLGGYGGTGFLEGLAALIGAAVSAFVILLFFYMLAELAIVLVDIAQNTRKTAEEEL